MKLKIWHDSDFGNPAFEREARDLKHAKEMLDLLADYDLHQGDRIISNAQGLVTLDDDGEWVEWEDEDGNNIDCTDLV